jgi:5-methylcytosine-specific restriction protein B
LNKAIDCAVVQKLMPKLHGSRKKLEGTLNALWKNCFEDEQLKQTTTILKDNIEKAQLPLTADKIYRMYNAALSNGFTSFSEA